MCWPLLLVPFCRGENWGSERLSYLLKDTQVGCDRGSGFTSQPHFLPSVKMGINNANLLALSLDVICLTQLTRHTVGLKSPHGSHSGICLDHFYGPLSSSHVSAPCNLQELVFRLFSCSQTFNTSLLPTFTQLFFIQPFNKYLMRP